MIHSYTTFRKYLSTYLTREGHKFDLRNKVAFAEYYVGVYGVYSMKGSSKFRRTFLFSVWERIQTNI